MSDILTLHWSNKPGKIVNKYTGKEIVVSEQMRKDLKSFNFYNTTKEWQETLTVSVIDLCNTTLKKYHNKKRPQITLEVSNKVLSILTNSHYFKMIENDASKIGMIQSTYNVNLNDEVSNCVNLYADNVLKGKVIVLDLEGQ